MNERERHLSNNERLAQETFARHVIREESEGRWLIEDPEHPANCWTEVICTYGKGLYVDGDIEPVVFRYGPEHPLARVSWMASREHAWDRYFREKATIGSGARADLDYWSRKVAAADIDEIIMIGAKDEALNREEWDALREARDSLKLDSFSRDDMCSVLYEIGMWEDCSSVGIVPSTRLFHAHAALQRLYALLIERGDYRPAEDTHAQDEAANESQCLMPSGTFVNGHCVDCAVPIQKHPGVRQ